MNTGAIAARYAKALLLLTAEKGSGERVYAQARALVENPDSAAGAELCPEIRDLVALLVRAGRVSLAKLVLVSFIRQYEEANDIHVVHLTTATPSPELQDKLMAFLRSKISGDLRFECGTDPSLIGGFLVETGNYRLDASVAGQLNEIKRELIEKNKRIV